MSHFYINPPLRFAGYADIVSVYDGKREDMSWRMAEMPDSWKKQGSCLDEHLGNAYT